MSNKIHPDQLQRWKQTLEDITPGQWFHCHALYYSKQEYDQCIKKLITDTPHEASVLNYIEPHNGYPIALVNNKKGFPDNADFIAEAPARIRQLIATIERLQKENKQLKRKLK